VVDAARRVMFEKERFSRVPLAPPVPGHEKTHVPATLAEPAFF
jgi:hypothetical protein